MKSSSFLLSTGQLRQFTKAHSLPEVRVLCRLSLPHDPVNGYNPLGGKLSLFASQGTQRLCGSTGLLGFFGGSSFQRPCFLQGLWRKIRVISTESRWSFFGRIAVRFFSNSAKVADENITPNP